MENLIKYMITGAIIVLLVTEGITIMGLYGNFSSPLNEFSDCTRQQLPALLDLYTTMIVTNWIIIAALLFILFRLGKKQCYY